tara:strand:- start:24 stop:563 length:540 start_codon:yes stop_codon:yes gene_type:complete
MPTIISHSLIGIFASRIFRINHKPKFWILSFICTALPDADMIGYYLGIPYNHLFGHRGISHSMFFALLLGFLVYFLFFRQEKLSKINSFMIFIYFSFVTMSHGFLDALTNASYGIPFFAPFDNTRYLFPYRPINAPSLDIQYFFKEQFFEIMIGEIILISIPIFVLLLTKFILKKLDKI